MATITQDAGQLGSDLVSQADKLIAAADAKVAAAAAAAQADKTKIIQALDAHIQVHKTSVAAHTAEITAAQALITKAQPAQPAPVSTEPQFLLTAQTDYQKVKTWVDAHWRTVVIVASLGVIVYGWKIL